MTFPLLPHASTLTHSNTPAHAVNTISPLAVTKIVYTGRNTCVVIAVNHYDTWEK
ncbi:MAG: hypothetical protein P8104_07505 [Gammaproteobacteria bacterium]